jgi:hypothetical protein
VPRLVEFLVEPRQACGVCGHRTDICLKDELLRWRGIDNLREPPEVGRAPISPAGVADIVSELEGFEAQLGVLEIAEGIVTGSREVPNGFIFHLGDRDCREIA